MEQRPEEGSRRLPASASSAAEGGSRSGSADGSRSASKEAARRSSDLELGKSFAPSRDNIPAQLNPLARGVDDDDDDKDEENGVEKLDEEVQRTLDLAKKLDQGIVYQFASPVFHFDVYLRQLVVQTVPHVGLLLFPRWANYVAMGYKVWKLGPVLFNHVMSIMAYCVVALIMILRSIDSPQHHLFASQQNNLWFSLLFYIMHRNLVAIKYASLHSAEYQKFMSSTNYEQALQYQRSMQIGTSWSLGMRTSMLLDFEITSAAVRMGCDLSKLYLVLPNPCSSLAAKTSQLYWNGFFLNVCMAAEGSGLSEKGSSNLSPLIRREDGTYVIMAADVIKAVLLESDQYCGNARKRVGHLPAFFLLADAIVVAFIPLMYSTFWKVASACKPFPELSALFTLWAICIIIVGIFFYFIIFTFVNIGVEDAQRRHREAQLLADLIRFSEQDVNLMILETSHAKQHEYRGRAESKNRYSQQRQPANEGGTAAGSKSQSRSQSQSRTQSWGSRERGSSGPLSDAVRDVVRRRRSNLADSGVDQKREVDGQMLSKLSAEIDAEAAAAAAAGEVGGMSSSGEDDKKAKGKGGGKHLSHRVADSAACKALTPADLSNLPAPQINMDFHGNNNILVWTFIRGVFRHFGARYKLRIDANVFTCTVLSVILLIVALALSIFDLAYPTSSTASDPDSSNSIGSPFTAQCIVSTSVFVITVVRLVRKSIAVNEVFRKHIFLLDGHILKAELQRTALREEIGEIDMHSLGAAAAAAAAARGDKDDDDVAKVEAEAAAKARAAAKAKLDDCSALLDALETCKRSVSVTDAMLPLKVLGIEATPSLLTGIISFAGSALSVFLSVYFTAAKAGSKSSSQ